MSLQELLPRLSIVRSDGESKIQRFWRWWSGEILHFVPPRIREALDSKERVLLVSVRDREMVVEYRHGSDRQVVDTIGLFGSPGGDAASSPAAQREADSVIVELPPTIAVRRQVTLPLGTEDRIAEVLGYEMDRLTPFAKDDVYSHHRVAKRDTARGIICIDLVVALKKTVDELLSALEQRGINASKVTLSGAAASTDRGLALVNLLPQQKRSSVASRWPMIPSALTVLAAMLVMAAIAYPLVQQNIVLGQLEKEVSELAPAAIAAGKTRDDIATAARQSGFFAEKWASMPTKIRVLDELTQVVPDDTWLTRIQMDGATVRIHGESEGASSLIGLIEASDLFRDVRFSSPVTKNPRTSNDRFVIEVQVEVEGAPGE